MTGLDTNVLARYFTQDDAAQSPKANALVAQCTVRAPGYINLIVLAELFWLLDQRYKYNREQQAELLRNLLQLVDLEVEAADDVRSAMSEYEKSTMQLSDCLISVRNRRASCRTTYTFDKAAARTAGFSLMQ